VIGEKAKTPDSTVNRGNKKGARRNLITLFTNTSAGYLT
jgi:hypothetical protein